MNITERITALRRLMRKNGLDAYIVPSGDAHRTGYVPVYWRTREWISGFTGSAGTLVVTADSAGLWTDSRYFIQAAQELEGTGIELHKMGEPGVKSYKQYLADILPIHGKLGFDGRVISAMEFDDIKTILKDKIVACFYQNDLVGELWIDRPLLPSKPAFEHKPAFAGKSTADKLNDVRAKMMEKKYTAYLVSALDDIAWLLNIRGMDTPYLPVVYAYAVITIKGAHVFVDSAKIADVSAKLTSQGITLHEYTELPRLLSIISTDKLYYNSAKTNVLLSETIPDDVITVNKHTEDIIPLLKAVKTNEELANIRNAFVKDGIVLVKTLKWLDEEADKVTPSAELPVSEVDVVRTVEKFRKEQPHYLCCSFLTTSAYCENAAIVHYKAVGNGAALRKEGLFLLDTGAQYLDGTTDTTRTVALGPLTDEMKRDFTLVLKGHIALARAKFLSGTSGAGLDILAKLPLWESRQSFNHGTGHGIGYCLSVHEGPQIISPSPSPELSPGMLLSNEPGLYKEGRYGIRTENVLLVVEDQKNEHGTFLSFENITHCPIDLRAIDLTVLTDTERDWLNSYHRRTYETLSPHLSEDECAWLKAATRQI